MTQVLNIKPRAPKRAVTLTDGAVTKINELLAAEGDDSLALRMAVRPGGCSGSPTRCSSTPRSRATTSSRSTEGCGVVVDPQSLDRPRGSVLDYKEGLMEGGFAINNPNVSRPCGCGNSFS